MLILLRFHRYHIMYATEGTYIRGRFSKQLSDGLSGLWTEVLCAQPAPSDGAFCGKPEFEYYYVKQPELREGFLKNLDS